MNKKWVIILSFFIIIGTTIGWSLLTQTGDTNINQPTTNENAGTDSDEPKKWWSSEIPLDWPAGLPAFIHVPEGEIGRISGSVNDSLRIYYDPQLSEKQVEEYIELCEENGFEVIYNVYYDDRFAGAAEKADERAKAGEWDEVYMTKDGYKVNLAPGGGSLFIGVPHPERTVVPLEWPEDIKATVPKPEHCQIYSIAKLSYGGYSIWCEYNDGDIRTDQYIQVLKELGFRETDRLINDNNETVYIIFENETMHVKLNPSHSSPYLILQITPITS